MQVSRSYRRDLRQELYYLQKFGAKATGAMEAGNYEDYLYQLLGRISFVLYVDPDNQEFLEARKLVNDRICKECYGGMLF